MIGRYVGGYVNGWMDTRDLCACVSRRTNIFHSLSLSLTHTHTHTYIYTQVRVWDPSSTANSAVTEEASLIIHSGENIPMAAAAWSDGRGLVYGCDDGSLHIWDLKRRREALSHPDRHVDGVKALDISQDGNWLVSGGADGCVRLLQTQSGAA